MQRLLVGALLMYCVIATGCGTVVAPKIMAALAGLLLVAGLWTPAAGVVTACVEVWIAFTSPAHAALAAALAVLAFTLALIGPGEWSVDARLYGRKHFVPPEF